MIHFIVAITPEANAIVSSFSMKKSPIGSLSVYASEEKGIHLLVTGAGKLNAAMAVTEYLTRVPVSSDDVFCNIGICGGTSGASVGDGFLCASVTELATEKTLYPELYGLPFPEARLFTSDTPVTALPSSIPSKGILPALFDMEAYGVASALYRFVMPSRCFFYKIVSDTCNGTFPTIEEVTALVQTHLDTVFDYLKEKEQAFLACASAHTALATELSDITAQLSQNFSFSTTMERKLSGLLTYALHAGFSTSDILKALPEKTDTPHKKKEAMALLQALEEYVLNTAPSSSGKDDSVFHQAACQEANRHPLCSTTPKATRRDFIHLSGNKKTLRPFRHIYVEREVLAHPITKQLLARFPQASVLPIEHYKAVFNRGHQDLYAEETEPALILTANHGTLFYPGAPVCQSFGEEHFMYTSCIMNCLYDCDYCYLQGMYPSRNIVVFVNLEDYFAELTSLLSKHPVYLCCSYDSDLTALNGLLPHAEEFCRFAAEHPSLRLELRTKSAALPFVRKLPAAKNIVMAFTLSPQEIITQYEHYTPSLKARLATAKEAARHGFSLRLCFDPILDVPNAEELYTTLVEETFSVLHPEEITDVSLGVFRLSKDYLKQLKKAKPSCAISHYPYELTDGVCHYRAKRCDDLLTIVRDALHRHQIQDDKLFIWAPEESEEGDSHVNE